MNTLFIIPARGGSKGLPGKNIKLLNNKPLICYSIDVARKFVADEMICVSTDDKEIINTVEKYGLKVPFVRPADLATDTATSYELVLHALNHYKDKNVEAVVLLQPTSPFRLAKHIDEAVKLFDSKTDAVISVKVTHVNPYSLLYIENKEGYIEKVLRGVNAERRQDLPKVFEINGAVYVYNAASLLKQNPSAFTKIKHYEMPEINSVDIDTPLDWAWAEFLIEKNLVNLDNKY